MALAGRIGYLAGTSVARQEQQVAVIDETGDFFPYLEAHLADSVK